jgi:two-component system sensor histidine kinase/response regulator
MNIANTGSALPILIAEDSATQAQRLRYILEQQGYRVTAAPNGRLALEAARRDKPALIISDVVMPEMNGYELCRRIKSDEQLCDIPVVLVTTLSDPHDVIRGLESRADNFILKPYEAEQLLHRIEFVLVNSRMRRSDQSGMGLEIMFGGRQHFITADRLQILNLLLSTYEAAMQRNQELSTTRDTLQQTNLQLEESNCQLRIANKDLDAYSSSVSHDLRGHLHRVIGFSQALMDGKAGPLSAEQRELMGYVNDGGTKLLRLADDLLHFARLGRQSVAKENVAVACLVQEILLELQGALPERTVELRIGTLPDAFVDPALFRQVLVNLLSNALKFTQYAPNPTIEITGEIRAGETIYCIRDNGAGFDMVHAHRLFSSFQRLHSESEFEGTGLGLAIVQRVIERHGGTVFVEAAVGKGAAFTITLPR